LQPEDHSISVLVKQDMGAGRLAARYAPGDRIFYRAGSQELGIADGSEVSVVRADAKTNTLTVATRDGNEIAYNPALTRKMTARSSIFREEERDIAIGERVRFTATMNGAKAGAFGILEVVGEDKAVIIRLDTGKSIHLTSDQPKNLDYGYTAENIHQARTNRVLIAKDFAQDGMEKLSAHVHDLSVYHSKTVESGTMGTEKSPAVLGQSFQILEPDEIGITR
jgi:hypothetical protein